jgi:phosphohistidine phosphatase
VNARGEVQLYLLRHAHAGDPMKWHGPDDVRPLSEKGRLQAERLGLFLAGTGFAPSTIVSSPKVRALETAQLVATALGLPVRVDDALAGPVDIDSLEALLSSLGDPGRPLLVGHDPAFSQLAGDLTGLAELPIRKGGLVRIDLMRPCEAGAGLVRWLLPPELLAIPD